MTNPFLGEIRMFAGNFAPRGWALCDGQLLPIAQNDALYALMGTTYGGDGQTTFGIPDLRGRIPVHMGTLQGGPTFTLGQMAGTESVTLTSNQIPAHTHVVAASQDAGDTATPTSSMVLGVGQSDRSFSTSTTVTPMAATSVSATGGNQPHENMQPYLAINFVIAIEGVFPSRN